MADTKIELVRPSSPDWQAWFNNLKAEMPHGATLDEADAIADAVADALSKKGIKVLK